MTKSKHGTSVKENQVDEKNPVEKLSRMFFYVKPFSLLATLFYNLLIEWDFTSFVSCAPSLYAL